MYYYTLSYIIFINLIHKYIFDIDLKDKIYQAQQGLLILSFTYFLLNTYY